MCAAFAGLTASAEAAVQPPGAFTVTFDRWQDGKYLITLSWQPVDGASRYTINYTPGDHPDAWTGYQIASVDGSVTQITQTFSPDVLDTADTFIIHASTDTGAGSGPATALLDLPRPHLDVTPINGKVGQLQVTTSPAFAGDSVTATMRGAPGTAPQPVDLGVDGSVLLTGLDYRYDYGFQMVETRPDAADDVSPPSIANAYPVPPAEHLWPIGTGPWDDNDPTRVPVAWSVPAGCDGLHPGNNCDLDFVIVKPGTTPSTDPSDGTDQSAAWSDVTNQFYSVLRDIQVGETYTVTVFRTMDRVHWGPGASLTFTNKLQTDKTLTASPAKAEALGEPVTLTASVTSSYTAPTGTVTFETNGSNRANVLCPPQTLPADGVVTCQTTTTAIASATQEQVGTRLIFINYSGDHNFIEDRGYFIEYDVTKALPALDAAHSARPNIHRLVTIRSKVTGKVGTPTGTVKMTNGRKVLCKAARLHSGRATCSVSGRKLGAGSRTVKVRYSGDRRYRVRTKKLSFTVKR